MNTNLNQELEKLSSDIRLFEILIESNIKRYEPNIKYSVMLKLISNEVKKKFGKREEQLLLSLVTSKIHSMRSYY